MATKAGDITFGVGFQVDASSLKELSATFKQIQDQVNSASLAGKLTPELKQAGEEAKKLSKVLNEAWSGRLQQFDLTKVNAGIKQTYGSVGKLKSSLEAVGPLGSVMYNQMAAGLMNTNLQLKQSNKLLDEMASTLANSFKYTLAYGAINSVTSGLQSAFNYAKSLDSSLNDIRIVTDKSAESMEKFAKHANSAAQGLGATTLDYTKASLIYFQQGLSDEETKARADVTLKAANVTGQSTQEVSEQLTAVWNGYKVSAEEAEIYVDKLAAVAATTASDLEELSTGMSKVASAANAMGVDIDQLNAQLATIVSVTRQAPESAGTALKTIYARMGDLELNGEDEFGVSLGKVSESLASVGIQILDTKGNLREMGEVIEEVGERWNSGEWSQAEKQALAIDLAGKRQYNNLLALFDNWDMYEKALKTSSESAGTLQHQQDIYMESTEAHFQQLTTETQRLYDLLFDTNTINEGVDAIRGILTSFDDFVEGIDGGTNAFIYFGSIIANIFNKQIAQGINTTINNINNLKKNVKTLGLLEGITQAGVSQPMAEITKKATADLAMQGIDTKGTNFKEQLPYMEKLLALQKNMSNEEFNQSQNLVAKIGKLAEEIELEEEKQRLVAAENKSAQDLQHNLDAQQVVYKEINSLLQDLYQKVNKSNPDEQIDLSAQMRKIEAKQKELDLTEKELALLEKLKAAEGIVGVESEEKEFILAKINQLYDQQGSSIEQTSIKLQAQTNLENGITQAKIEQLRILKEQAAEREKEFQQRQRIQTVVRGVTAATQALSAITGAIATGLNEEATGAEKLNAGFAAVSGTAASIANYVMPGSGIIVQGIFAIGQNLLKATGIWDKWEYACKSAKEKMDDLNTSMKEFADISSTYTKDTQSLEKIADEFAELSGLAGNYGENLNNLTQEQQDRYHELVDEITKYNEAAILGYDAQGEKIVNNNQLLQDTINLLREKYEIEAAEQFSSDYSNNKQTYEDDYNAAYRELQAAQEAANSEQESSNDTYEWLLDEIKNTAAAGTMQTTVDQTLRPLLENRVGLGEFSAAIDKLATDENVALQANAKRFKETYAEFIQAEIDNIEYTQDRITIAQNELDKKTLPTTLLSNAIKYLDSENDEWKELSALAQEQGVQNIETFVSSYISGLNINDFVTNGELNLDTAIQAIQTYEQQLIDAINEGLTPDEINIDPSQFTQYEDYVEAVFAKLRELIADGKLNQNNADAIAALFGFDHITISDDNIVTGYMDALQKAKNKITDYIKQTSGNESITVSNLEFTIDELQNADTFIEFLDEAVLKTNDWDDALKYAKEDFQEMRESEERQTSLGAIDSVISLLEKDTKLTKKELSELNELELQIGDTENRLAQIRDKNSKEYLKAIQDVQQSLEDQERIAAESSYSKKLERAKHEVVRDKKDGSGEETVVRLRLDDEEFNDTLSSILEADYSVEVAIKADIESDFANSIDELTSIESMTQKIGEDFIVAADDIREMNAAFPGILQGMEYLADGTVKLNQDAVASATALAQEEANASTQAALDKMKAEQQVFMAKAAAHKRILDVLKKANNKELEDDKAKSKAQAEIDSALNELESLNSKQKADNVIKNDQEMTDAADKEAKATAENWTDSANAIANAMYQAADSSIKNFQEMAKGPEGAATPPDIKISYKGGHTGGSASATQGTVENNGLDLSDVGLDLESLITEEEEILNSYIDAAQDIEGMMGELTAKSIESANSVRNAAEGKGGKKSKSSSSSKESEDKKQLLKLEDEIDLYREVNEQLEEVDHNLKMLQKQEDRTYGAQHIENLKAQSAELAKQQKLIEKKLGLTKQDLAMRQKLLSAQGVQFGADGDISNYQALLTEKINNINALYTQYNNTLDKALKSTIKTQADNAKEEYESLKKSIEAYEKLQDQMDQLNEQWQDARNAEIDKQIEAFNYRIDLDLNVAKATKRWNEFKRKVVDDMENIADPVKKVIEQMKAGIEDYRTTYSAGGEVAINTGAVRETLDQFNQMMATGTASIYGNNPAQLVADLEKRKEDLMKSVEDAEQMIADMRKMYLDGLDEAYDKMEKHTEQYEYISNLIEHDINLIELLRGEEAYEDMGRYYDRQAQNNIKNVEFLKMQRDALREQVDSLEKDSKAWKKVYQQLQDTEMELRDSVNESVQLLLDRYENGLNKILKDLDKKVSGGMGVDYLQEQYEMQQDLADNYLDSVNQAYALEKLRAKFTKAINDTTDIKVREKLTNLLHEQVDALAEKEKLAQYEVDHAEKMLEVEQARIALEEAQANKSQMRLKRDNQGNYSYQYVADEDAIDDAQQDLLDAENDLWNFDVEGLRTAREEAIKIWQEYFENLREIWEDTSLTEEERQQKLLDLDNWRTGELEANVEKYNFFKTNTEQDANTILADLYSQNADEFGRVVMEEILPDWNSGVDSMIEKYAGEGIPACQEALAQLQANTEEYRTKVDELAEAAGMDFEEICNGIDMTIDYTYSLMNTNEEMIDQYRREMDELNELNRILEDVQREFQAAREEAIRMAQEATNAIQKANELRAASEAAKAAADAAAASASQSSYYSGGGSGGGSGSGSGGGQTGSGGSSSSDTGRNYKVVGYDERGISITIYDKTLREAQEIMEQYNRRGGKTRVAHYDTGGYTGDWHSSEGKVAMLHEKEIVLNKHDTENMLDAVNVVRHIVASLDGSMLGRLADMSALAFNSITPGIETSNETLEQNVHIEASFPNATNRNEIEEAFNNLVNIASQKALNTRR